MYYKYFETNMEIKNFYVKEDQENYTGYTSNF